MTLNTSLFSRDQLAVAPMPEEHALQLSAAAAGPRAIRIEGTDAAGTRATGYAMAVGDTFNGRLSSGGDQDWVRVTLRPGTYVITLEGRGANALDDPILRVMNSNGTVIMTDDDSGRGINSKAILQVNVAGTYYISAGGYADSRTGDYSLQVNARAKADFWAMDEIADQLTDGFWEGRGESRRAFDVGADGSITVDLSQLTVAGRVLAERALDVWEAVTGINFVNSGAGAEIIFDDSDSGAYSTSEVFGGFITSSYVNIGLDWLQAYGTGYDSYSYQTYIHEIGHALGLGHAGNYNGDAIYGADNLYPNDSWQATVMSYFSQTDNTAIRGSQAYVMTAMMADIIAMQDLYGPTSIRTGNNTYGEQTNAGSAYSLVAEMLRDPGRYDDITFTVFDQGGKDLLDLRTDSSDQRINMAPGGISSAYGLIGNISIAEGTIIEDLLTGTGSDYVLGNGSDNLVRGGLGRDTIYGFAGNDTLFGDRGIDHLVGGSGNDAYVVDRGDTVSEAVNSGTDKVYSYVSYRLGDNLEHLTLAIGTAQYGGGNSLNNLLTGNNVVNLLQGFGGNDALSGQAGNDTLYGDDGNDSLYGGDGNDWLWSGRGLDLLNGGAGDDVYVTDATDVIIGEVAGPGGGIDTVRATATAALSANVENLILVGSGVQHGYGNLLSNVLIGNAAGNVLSGFGGNDTLTGGAGADNFIFRSGRDRITDFIDNVDTIRIDDLAWGGGARTIAQVLDDAEVIGGNTVFDFGNGNTLTVVGLTNIAALQNDLVLF